MTPRLATSVWVAALLRRAEAAGVFGAVLHKGDPTAGAVVIVARARDGSMAAWARATRGDETGWAVAIKAGADQFAKVDDYLARQLRYDPDLWTIELVGEEIQPLIA